MKHIKCLTSTRKHDLYFVSAPGAGMIKIGVTDDLETRLAMLRNGSPVPLDVLLVVRGTTRQEQGLHLRFAIERTHGEWFRASPRLLAFIDEMTGMPGDAVADVLSRLRTPAPFRDRNAPKWFQALSRRQRAHWKKFRAAQQEWAWSEWRKVHGSRRDDEDRSAA